jgi:hypothetical protein
LEWAAARKARRSRRRERRERVCERKGWRDIGEWADKLRAGGCDRKRRTDLEHALLPTLEHLHRDDLNLSVLRSSLLSLLSSQLSLLHVLVIRISPLELLILVLPKLSLLLHSSGLLPLLRLGFLLGLLLPLELLLRLWLRLFFLVLVLSEFEKLLVVLLKVFVELGVGLGEVGEGVLVWFLALVEVVEGGKVVVGVS